MSLINDALKRAREAQKNAPPPEAPQPQLRSEDTEKHARHNLGLLVPVSLALLALAGLVVVWLVWRQHGTGDVQQVAAKSPSTTNAPALSSLPPAIVAAASATAPTNASQSSLAAKGASAASTEAANPASSSLAPAPAVVAPVPEPAPVKPPPKLQGIVFNPRRPSALIDGKTVFVGDRVGEFRVIAITASTATLATKGVTNVLSLSD